LIESGEKEGMKIDLIDGKGRGVIDTKQFSRGDLVVIYCFSFCLLWKTFIAPSILNDSFAR
jgi:hypothetical protein